MTEFKLSASLTGHDDDVRAVTFPTSKAVISASRDATVRVWNSVSSSPPKYDATITSHGTSFINSVAYLPPNPAYADGLIVAGGKDTIIEVRKPNRGPEENAEALLLGHTSNVCALAVEASGEYIVSGSWDGTARIWPIGRWECSAVLEGHQGSVWAVLAFDAETIITGSADTFIKIYHVSGKTMRTIKGGSDVVRALCKVPKGHPSGADFASAGNDGIVRLWTLDGRQVGELLGHESFIYSLAVTDAGELVSSGEDRTVRIWKGTTCIQTITHPAISVWAVAVCAESGDIVSGASDRIVRVFSRSNERLADAETLRLFDEAVQTSSIPQQQMGDINKEKLPGPEFLQQKSGTKEGQVVMIKQQDGSVTAHQWSSGQQEWMNVGTVVDAVGSSGKKVPYNGKEYDYVFDVDIEDGKPALKLPYNLSQNPYEAATKFIGDNELPMTYLDQVANFITTNTQGASIGTQSQSSGSADPWGTGSRYRPGDGAQTESVATSKPKILPQKDFLSIVVAQVDKIQKKIEELNQSMIAEGRKDISLNPTELETLADLRRYLATPGSKPGTQVPNGGVQLATKLITAWPYGNRLPGLDLVRLLAVSPAMATFEPSQSRNIVRLLASSINDGQPVADNNIMMAVRAFANLFESARGRHLAVEEFDTIQDVITASLARGSTNRNLLVAATTMYINYAVLLTTEEEGMPNSFEHALALLETLNSMLAAQSDSEVVYRAMVAVGTLLTMEEEVRSAAKEVYSVGVTIDAVASKASDPRIKNVAAEIRALLR